jgi:hypothetical protein
VSNEMRASGPRLLLAVVATCVLVLVIVALAQSQELVVPTLGGCRHARGALAHCLDVLSSERNSALHYAWFGAAVVAVGGALIVVWASRATRLLDVPSRGSRALGGPAASLTGEREQTSHQSGHASSTPLSSARHEPSDRIARDRATLVEACIAMSELVDSVALRERLDDVLADVGVSAVVARPGEAFDPSRFSAAGTVPTTDSRLDGAVASMERRGYSDRGKRLRYPEVIVYRSAESSDR